MPEGSKVYRSALELYVDVLKACIKKKYISNIAQTANLNHYEIKDRIDFLLERGYVSAEPGNGGNNLYTCSEKGTRLIDSVEGNPLIMEILKEGHVFYGKRPVKQRPGSGPDKN